jgi:hypothetical protein
MRREPWRRTQALLLLSVRQGFEPTAPWRVSLSDEQEKIIKANNEAVEELALRWRDPETGETEPDLRRAVRAAKILSDIPGVTLEAAAALLKECRSARERRGGKFEEPRR